MTKYLKLAACLVVLCGLIFFGVYLWQGYIKYQQGLPSLFFHPRNTYSQYETVVFGNVSIHLTRMRLIKDTTASEEEVDVNFDAHNNQNDILNLDGYHFQVVTNGQYDWVDQNNFQYGYIAPHSDMQEYFVAHMGIGYTEPITLVISKDGVTKSIVVTKPEITSAPPSSPTVGTDPTDPFRNLFKR